MKKQPKGMSYSARIAISKSSTQIAADRNSSGIINIGCRYVDFRTGCRCAAEVADQEPFCVEHKGLEPRQVSGFGASSLYFRER